MKRVLLALALFCAFFQIASAQTTPISATRIMDSSGNLLSTGQWCFGSSCFPVLNGSIPSGSSVTPGTATVTVSNGPVTFLTVPNVSIAGSLLSWDTYTVPSNGNIYGMGAPRLACTPGASYTQTDATLYTRNNDALYTQSQWQCEGVNWVGAWVAYPSHVRRTELP